MTGLEAAAASKSTWFTRLQASQNAQKEPKSLDCDVRSRLLRGANVKSLWRELRQALGEDELERVARQGWDLQRQAVNLPASSEGEDAVTTATTGSSESGEGRSSYQNQDQHGINHYQHQYHIDNQEQNSKQNYDQRQQHHGQQNNFGQSYSQNQLQHQPNYSYGSTQFDGQQVQSQQTKVENDVNTFGAGNTSQSISFTFNPSNFDLEMEDSEDDDAYGANQRDDGSFVFRNSYEYNNLANDANDHSAHNGYANSPYSQNTWSSPQPPANMYMNPDQAPNEQYNHYTANPTSSANPDNFPAVVAARVKRGISNVHDMAAPDYYSHGGSASSSSTTSWGATASNTPSNNTYTSPQYKRRFLS